MKNLLLLRFEKKWVENEFISEQTDGVTLVVIVNKYNLVDTVNTAHCIFFLHNFPYFQKKNPKHKNPLTNKSMKKNPQTRLINLKSVFAETVQMNISRSHCSLITHTVCL